MLDRLSYAWEVWYARFWTRHFARVVFVHINKTAGSSIETALGIPFQHRTAVQFRDLMGPERFERAFRFTIVRNPWAKVASHYRYRVKTNQTGLGVDPIPFPDWVKRSYGDRDPRYYDQPLMFAPHCAWFTDEEGQDLVEFIGRFERLQEDFRVIAERLGLPADLPHEKSTGVRPWQDIYDEEARRVVGECFAADVERFGYRFEDG